MDLIPAIERIDPETWDGPGQINGFDFVGYNLLFGGFKVNPDINPVSGQYNNVNGDINVNASYRCKLCISFLDCSRFIKQR